MFFDVLTDEEVVLRHLTADDVLTVVVGAADHMTFQNVVLREVKIVDPDGQGSSFVRCKIAVAGQKSKAVGTDVVQRAFHGGAAVLQGYRAGVFQIHTGIFPAIVDLRSGLDRDREGISALGGNLYAVPQIQDVADRHFQLTGDGRGYRRRLREGRGQGIVVLFGKRTVIFFVVQRNAQLHAGLKILSTHKSADAQLTHEGLDDGLDRGNVGRRLVILAQHPVVDLAGIGDGSGHIGDDL